MFVDLGSSLFTFMQVLFDVCRWDFLVEEFKQEFCKLFGMTLVPLLQIYLQAGLSALKTPYASSLLPFNMLCLFLGLNSVIIIKI